MGASSASKKSFLSKHQMCCFCGGTVLSATIDHVPPRTLFKDRKWPEGYIFPACERCNDITRKSELLVAMMCRMYPNASGENDSKQLENLIKSAHRNFPGLLESMKLPAAKKRRLVREAGVSIPEGEAASEAGLFSIADPRFNCAIEQFSTKLFSALYYLHTVKILPRNGGIVFRWFSNTQNIDEMLPKDALAPLLTGFPELRRGKTSLNDQFFYRYAVTSEKEAAVFFVIFNYSIALLGFVFPDISRVKIPDGATVLKPF